MIIEFASEVSNLAWRVSQSQNGSAIFTLTKWSPMFGSVVFDHQWCILIVMSVKSSFYNEYDIKNNEKHVLWAQRSFQNHHQTFHDRCPEKIGPLPKKSDHWFTRTCPENIRPAPTCYQSTGGGLMDCGPTAEIGVSLNFVVNSKPLPESLLTYHQRCFVTFVAFIGE